MINLRAIAVAAIVALIASGPTHASLSFNSLSFSGARQNALAAPTTGVPHLNGAAVESRSSATRCQWRSRTVAY